MSELRPSDARMRAVHTMCQFGYDAMELGATYVAYLRPPAPPLMDVSPSWSCMHHHQTREEALTCAEEAWLLVVVALSWSSSAAIAKFMERWESLFAVGSAG